MSDDEDLELTPEEKEELKNAFQALDKDGNGTLSRDEIRNALDVLLLKTTEEQFDNLIDKIDVDKWAARSQWGRGQ